MDEIYPLPIGHFLSRVRKLACVNLDTLEMLDSRLKGFIGVNSNAAIQSDVLELNDQFTKLGLDLREEVRNRFESTHLRSSEDHLLKAIYARILLILGEGLCYPLTNRISNKEQDGEDEYNFAMDFLKSLNQDDKEQFIKEADCVNNDDLKNLASRLIEITGNNKTEAGIHVFKTIINHLAEQSNPAVYTQVITLPKEAILRKQTLALHVLSETDVKVLPDDLTASAEVLSGVVDKLAEMAVYGAHQAQRENAIAILNRFTDNEWEELLPPESKKLLFQAAGIVVNH
ncbi:MAG: hypothetical protein A3F80_09450 [Candidatus Melainabacteria bacterium RIFCSPLOWO2_12_FULL_35_11]|nr:MAG: hypothetical protein A3F80_09450 [Candidatus Melainabacteria bacterium RIFCSPLOWO2_12_FULL_35_11]